MADAFTLGFPVKFESGGDTTRDAFGKHRQEINKIYTHLNWLNTHKVEASEVNGQIAGVESKLTTHINSSNPHPNYTPPVPSLDSLSGTLDVSKITGNFGTDRISGLEDYVKGLIPDKGDGVTEQTINDQDGHIKFSNGLILKWGNALNIFENGQEGTYTFSKAFPAQCYTVLLTYKRLNTGALDDSWVQLRSWSRAGFVCYRQADDAHTGGSQDAYVTFIAIGK